MFVLETFQRRSGGNQQKVFVFHQIETNSFHSGDRVPLDITINRAIDERRV